MRDALRLEFRTKTWLRAWRARLSGFVPLAALLYIVGSVVYILIGGPFSGLAIALSILALAYLIRGGVRARQYIDVRLASRTGWLHGCSVLTKSLPLYRFVDVYDAVNRLASAHREWSRIESAHFHPLQTVMSGQFPVEGQRLIQAPERIARPADYGRERFIPTDTFFAVPVSDTRPAHIIRVRWNS